MRTLALLPATLLLLGCTPYTLRLDYDPGAGFAAYRTFEWYAASRRAQARRPAGGSDLMDRRIRAAAERRLEARGYAPATGAEPDFLVTAYAVYRDRRYRTTTSIGFGAAGRLRPWGYGVGTRFSEIRRVREGTLVLEIVDGRSNQLVWQAAAEGALTGLDSPEEAQEQVDRTVAELLERFPPRQKG